MALLLRSGDVVVMGGASRLCLHGVAKVCVGTAPGFGPPPYLHPTTARHLPAVVSEVEERESGSAMEKHKRKRSDPCAAGAPEASSGVAVHHVDCVRVRVSTDEGEGAEAETGEVVRSQSQELCDPCSAEDVDVLLQEWRVLRYLQTARINVNVRQVHLHPEYDRRANHS